MGTAIVYRGDRSGPITTKHQRLKALAPRLHWLGPATGGLGFRV